MNRGPEAGLFCFPFYIFLFLYVLLDHSPKIVGQIRGVFSFGGTLFWVTSPSWPPPKPTAGSASGGRVEIIRLATELWEGRRTVHSAAPRPLIGRISEFDTDP